MKSPMRVVFASLIVALGISPAARGQNVQPVQRAPRLVICGGGSLPESVFKEFRKLASPEALLVVIPTASPRKCDVEMVQKLWQSRGFQDVRVLHTNDRKVAASAEFAEPLRTATAVWFGGGSQQRIADAYLGTPVEKELYQLVQRGGVIGGTSAGAAIQSRVMIAQGNSQPKMSTGLDLLPGAIVDQHFLKRNRFPRLLAAIRTHPKLIGIGVDEATALVVCDGKAKVVGRSYVIRVASVEGEIKVDAFGDEKTVPLADR